MDHARIRALKGDSGKTVSRKAIKSGRASSSQTPRHSPIPSLLTSPSHSAAPSRVGSDISDDDVDFDDVMSTASASSLIEVNEEDGISMFDVSKFLEEMQDRKRNNGDTREQLLEFYIKTLRSHYNPHTHLWLDGSAQVLAELFLRSANRGLTARERLLSLQALVLTMGTSEEVSIVEESLDTIRHIIMDDDDDDCRVFAMYAMCFAVLYGGGDEDDAQTTLDFLADIVQTDGESIEAHDNAVLVAGAMQAWAFIASHVEDMSDSAFVAIDGFVDQLDSGHVLVQSHAAACIALIFEASREHEHDTGAPFQLPYDPKQLAGRINQIAKQFSRSVSKKDRRSLRDTLNSVVTSLERGVGPGYSTAGFAPDARGEKPTGKVNEDGIVEFGYRLKLRLGNHVAIIKTWSLLSRVDMMKLLFGGSLLRHVFDNPVVSECLSDASFEENGPAQKTTKHMVANGGGKR